MARAVAFGSVTTPRFGASKRFDCPASRLTPVTIIRTFGELRVLLERFVVLVDATGPDAAAH